MNKAIYQGLYLWYSRQRQIYPGWLNVWPKYMKVVPAYC